MVNFHFQQFFRFFRIFHEYGQNYLSNSKVPGNTTSEPKKKQEDHNEKIQHFGAHARPYRDDADCLPQQ